MQDRIAYNKIIGISPAIFARVDSWDFGGLTVVHRSQYTRDIEPVFVECWPTICDAGPALSQHWLSTAPPAHKKH